MACRHPLSRDNIDVFIGADAHNDTGDAVGFFSGDIHQVRFSKAALYTKDFTAPNNLEKNDDTFALYRLDEGAGVIAHDSSGTGHDGEIVGAKWVRSGGVNTARVAPGNYALEFEGESSYAEFDVDPPPPLGSEYTLEAYLTPLQLPGQYAVFIFNRCEANRYLQFNHGFWSFVSVKDHVYSEARSEKRVTAGQRVHVAATVVNEKVTLFVDGVCQGGKNLTGPQPTARKWVTRIQGNDGDNRLAFFMDEFRISNIARYTENFVPAARHQTDAHTVALYHFDEGQGDVLHDYSRNQRHCKVVGAEWVRVETLGDAPSADSTIFPEDG